MDLAVCSGNDGDLAAYNGKRISLGTLLEVTGTRDPKQLSKYHMFCPGCNYPVYSYGALRLVTGVKINLEYKNTAHETTRNAKKYSTNPGFRHNPNPDRPECRYSVKYDKTEDTNVYAVSAERKKEVLEVLSTPENHTKYIASIMSIIRDPNPYEADRIASAWKEKASGEEYLKDHDWFYPYMALMMENRVVYRNTKGNPQDVVFEHYHGSGSQEYSFSSPEFTERTGLIPTVTLPNEICMRRYNNDGRLSRIPIMKYKGVVYTFKVSKNEIETRANSRTAFDADGVRKIWYQEALVL